MAVGSDGEHKVSQGENVRRAFGLDWNQGTRSRGPRVRVFLIDSNSTFLGIPDFLIGHASHRAILITRTLDRSSRLSSERPADDPLLPASTIVHVAGCELFSPRVEKCRSVGNGTGFETEN